MYIYLHKYKCIKIWEAINIINPQITCQLSLSRYLTRSTLQPTITPGKDDDEFSGSKLHFSTVEGATINKETPYTHGTYRMIEVTRPWVALYVLLGHIKYKLYIHICINTHTYRYIYIYIHTYIHVHTHICVYVYVYILIYICVYIYVYTI